MPAKRSKDRAPIDNGEKYVVLHDDDGEPVLRIWSAFLKPSESFLKRPTTTTTTSVCEDVVTAEEKTTEEKTTISTVEKTTITEDEKPTSTIEPEEKATPTIRGAVTSSSYYDPKTQLQSVQSTMASPQPAGTGANPKGYWLFYGLQKSDVPLSATTVVFVPPYDRGEVFPLRFFNKTQHYLYVRTSIDCEERTVLVPRAMYRMRNMPPTQVRDPKGTVSKLVNRVLDPVPSSAERSSGPKYFLVPPGGNHVQAIYVKKTSKFKYPLAGTDNVSVDIVTSLSDISILHKEKGVDWPFNTAFAKYPGRYLRYQVKLFYARASNEAIEGDPTGQYVCLGGDEENTKDGQDAKAKDKKK
ncbi:hypothetical protein AAVH_11797 [Aphelenchoides avenae]|nr:hypothetical protein AAVH_11797 [Aphelenchus avenae]